MRKYRLICFIMFLILSFASINLSALKEEKVLHEKLEPYIQRFMGWYGIPGLAISVVKNDKIIYARGFGVKNIKEKEKVTPSTLFSTASVTKVFVGTAIMQLYEKGNLELDKPIVNYLPYFKLRDDRYKKITARHLVRHCSGMPDAAGEEFYNSWKNPEFDDGALERYVRSISNTALISNPGEKFCYSSMGYDVLGDLVAKRSKISLEDYIKQNILKPLKMMNSTLLYKETNKKVLAGPHKLKKDFTYEVNAVFPYTRRHSASGTLFSNVLEMGRWIIANINHGELDGISILKDSSYDIMWKSDKKNNIPIGISWLVENVDKYTLVSHSGGDPGFRTDLIIIPEKKVGVCIMSNCWDNLIQPIAYKALNIMLKEDSKDWFTFFHGSIFKSLRENNIKKTIGFCRDLVQKHGKNNFHPAILNQHGRTLIEFKRYQEACELFKLNIELYPKIYQLYNSLANCYQKMGKTGLAKKIYKKSLTVNPNNKEAVEFLKKFN